MVVCVLGYYHRHNLGDDCFAIVIKHLCKDLRVSLQFCNTDDVEELPDDTNAVIVGGGDIINPYFIDKIRRLVTKIPVIIISAGVPYVNAIPGSNYLNFASNIVTRNLQDVHMLSSKTLGLVDFCPDIVHLLPDALTDDGEKHVLNRRTVAFCLTRTIFHPRYKIEYYDVVSKLVDVIQKLVVFHGLSVVLIPFGINLEKDRENDIKLNSQIMAHMGALRRYVRAISPQDIAYDYNEQDATPYAQYVSDVLRHADIAVVSRFHAHVMCVNNCVPFVSMSPTRKVAEFLRQYYFEDAAFSVKVSDINSPIDLDVSELCSKIMQTLQDRSAHVKRIALISSQIRKHLAHFESFFKRFVSRFETLLAE